MNNILIPTDFSPRSVNDAADAVRNIGGRSDIFFFHALDTPDSLTEAMTRLGVRGDGRLITDDFRANCKKIKNDHWEIMNIFIRIMYGSSLAAFKAFADANAIDMIFLPEHYKFRSVSRGSVDPASWFSRSGIPVVSRNTVLQNELVFDVMRSSFTLN
ncbi:MAG: hypothetical protein KF744_09955 [Taibaiella sp.]|nr:hypothetical protein [Taibaiella sp.]